MGSREYSYRYRCPYCRKLYAKKALWVKHIGTHTKENHARPRRTQAC